MSVLRLSAADARRVAVRAQWLNLPRPPGLLAVLRRLTLLQVDPTAAVAPSVHLVLWSRLGWSYDQADLEAALEQRTVVELASLLRPAEDLALYRAEMEAWPGDGDEWRTSLAGWLRDNDGCRLDLLRRLDEDGPLRTRDLPDSCVRPWRSTGWTNNQNVTRVLELMAARGEVALAGRRGRERLWDLAERVYPDLSAVPVEEAVRRRDERRLAALGLARARGQSMPGEPVGVGQAGMACVVDGVAGEWRVHAEYLEGTFTGRTALLSPLDRLVHDRRRMAELFGFDYQLEMYKPAAARRWGFFALPVLHHDRLVGKVDAAADHRGGVLRVHAVHQDHPFDDDTHDGVAAELADLARWLGLELRAPAGW